MVLIESKVQRYFEIFKSNAKDDLAKLYGAANAARILKALDEELSDLEDAILSDLRRQ